MSFMEDMDLVHTAVSRLAYLSFWVTTFRPVASHDLSLCQKGRAPYNVRGTAEVVSQSVICSEDAVNRQWHRCHPQAVDGVGVSLLVLFA